MSEKSKIRKALTLGTITAVGAASAGGLLYKEGQISTTKANKTALETTVPVPESVTKRLEELMSRHPDRILRVFQDGTPNLLGVTYKFTEGHSDVSNLTELIVPEQVQSDAYDNVLTYKKTPVVNPGDKVTVDINANGYIVADPRSKEEQPLN